MESYLPNSDRHAASWIFSDGPTKPAGVVKLRYNALKLFFYDVAIFYAIRFRQPLSLPAWRQNIFAHSSKTASTSVQISKWLYCTRNRHYNIVADTRNRWGIHIQFVERWKTTTFGVVRMSLMNFAGKNGLLFDATTALANDSVHGMEPYCFQMRINSTPSHRGWEFYEEHLGAVSQEAPRISACVNNTGFGDYFTLTSSFGGTSKRLRFFCQL